MSHASLAWTVLAWLLAAAATGFVGAWWIQQWRMAAGRAAGADLEREVAALRDRATTMPAAANEPSVIETSASHWKSQDEQNALGEAQAHYQSALAAQQAEHRGILAELQARSEAALAEEQAKRQAALADTLVQSAAALTEERAHGQAALADAEAKHVSALAEEQAKRLAALAEAQAQHEAVLAKERAQQQAEAQARQASALAEERAKRKAALARQQTRHQEELQALAQLHQQALAELEALRQAARTADSGRNEAEADLARLAAQERELSLLRAQLGGSSERVLELEQALNRLQLDALGHGRQLEDLRSGHAAALARLGEELQVARAQLAQRPQALAGTPQPAGGTSNESVEEAPLRARMEQQRLQQLEEGMARARRQAGEHRAEVAGLKGRIRDLEERLEQLWQQEHGQTPDSGI